jgi:hypothetical protein
MLPATEILDCKLHLLQTLLSVSKSMQPDIGVCSPEGVGGTPSSDGIESSMVESSVSLVGMDVSLF